MLNIFSKKGREKEKENPPVSRIEKKLALAEKYTNDASAMLNHICYSDDWKRVFIPLRFSLNDEEEIVLEVKFEDTLEGMVNLVRIDRIYPSHFEFLVNARKRWESITKTVEKFGYIFTKAEDEEEGIKIY